MHVSLVLDCKLYQLLCYIYLSMQLFVVWLRKTNQHSLNNYVEIITSATAFLRK